MFIAGSISSSALWGYASDNIGRHDDATVVTHGFSGSGNTTGDMGPGTLGPDGLVYMLPAGNYKSDNATAINEIIVIQPGNANSAATSWSRAKAFHVAADGTSNGPPLS